MIQKPAYIRLNKKININLIENYNGLDKEKEFIYLFYNEIPILFIDKDDGRIFTCWLDEDHQNALTNLGVSIDDTHTSEGTKHIEVNF
jgi:hypothetical protein